MTHYEEFSTTTTSSSSSVVESENRYEAFFDDSGDSLNSEDEFGPLPSKRKREKTFFSFLKQTNFRFTK